MFGLLVAVKGESANDLWRHLLAHAGYLHNVIFPGTAGVQFIAWSLEIEVQFYILAPLLALAFVVPAAGRYWLLFVLAGAAMLAQWRWGMAMRELPTLANFAQFFLGGFALAGVAVTRWREPAARRVAFAWDGVTILGWPALFVVWESSTATAVLLPVLLPLLTAGALRGHFSRRLFSLPALARIGGFCYSIYLIHYPLISLAGRYTMRLRATNSFAINLLLQSALIVPVVLIGSVMFFVVAERPFMARNWPARASAFLARRPAPRSKVVQ